jgi:tetratricopeptide (TPR) repeat protein
VIELHPDSAPALRNRGFLRFRRKDIEGACRDLERALDLDPKHANALWYRGRCREARGERSRALADFEAAVALDPSLRPYLDKVKTAGTPAP